jgi:hypothetical protein
VNDNLWNRALPNHATALHFRYFEKCIGEKTSRNASWIILIWILHFLKKWNEGAKCWAQSSILSARRYLFGVFQWLISINIIARRKEHTVKKFRDSVLLLMWNTFELMTRKRPHSSVSRVAGWYSGGPGSNLGQAPHISHPMTFAALTALGF